MILSPSMLSSDFANMESELKALQEAGLEWVHLDVMDGQFVPNITFGPPIIKAMRKKSNLFFDCHLMIEDPGRYIQDFADAGADLICVHAEACTHLERVCSQIADAGCKPAVALNPHTTVDSIRYLLPQLHMVLLMSVNPGFGGQKFIPFTMDKLRELKAMITDCGSQALIQVDGGVTPENTPDLVRAGADVLVSGSAFFGFPPYSQRHKTFMEAAAKA
ncbi:ribulose-phosphate 3-epimerase [Pseudodesulfovibrio senegalensis]|jgi:ribulose-phosphate 3-epimerase|uniref:Ribulose-phosphate 3-epimerase n=1 Tax=Pseudodesulfovibrio senegalensis TaxID=1721087 RepID=A0A6N6N3H7_9BACT|nr:ribulose-phosphate 3-epimerase [Pseudodesulfovibrio senegalensis]KAB1442373.1 ribulose-phosphate 3-epimerase [Pseudodesulfovibrio senegalensis]